MLASGKGEWPPEELWRCFRVPLPETIQKITTGLSSDPLFRVKNTQGNWALKSSPFTPEWKQKRSALHEILRGASLVVPEYISCPAITSLVVMEGRIWELFPWIVGEQKTCSELGPKHWRELARFLKIAHLGLRKSGGESKAPIGYLPSFQSRFVELKKAWDHLYGGPLVWPEPFLAHPSWSTISPRLKETIGWALQDLAWMQKQSVGIQPIHGDPHLGNWLWRKDLPVGLVDFLGPRDCIEADIARICGSDELDPFEVCRVFCLGYAEMDKVELDQSVGIALAMLFSGLTARIFRWRNWLLGGNVSVAAARIRLNGVLDQFPKAISWRQNRNWPGAM